MQDRRDAGYWSRSEQSHIIRGCGWQQADIWATGVLGKERWRAMKITLQKVDSGDEEIIIRYEEMTRKISDVIKLLSDSDNRIAGTKEDTRQMYYFAPEEVYYFESVDGVVYAYLEKEVYRVREKLEEIVYQYGDLGIARCTRTMAANLYKVEWLKSQPGGRILAELQNGEKIMISRKYAEPLRRQLRRGSGRDGK